MLEVYMPVIESAPAKINLALHILGRRSDGYHQLDSVVVFADIADRISLEPASTASLSVSGPFAADLAGQAPNIVLKAEQQMRALAGHAVQLPHFAISLEKNLPVASGIGGGSADAAATLRAIQRYINNPPTGFRDSLAKVALSLGADVPVCLNNKPCRMQGIGEIISTVNPRLPQNIILVNPGLPLVTKNVFTAMNPVDYQGKPPLDLSAPETWRNDMAKAAITMLPEIADVLSAIRSEPAVTLSNMSGSGATCFGLSESQQTVEDAAARIQSSHPRWWVRTGKLLNL
jgi:4-diphosphocytidyl-2-C-methyl-D-erythritol kinase